MEKIITRSNLASVKKDTSIYGAAEKAVANQTNNDDEKLTRYALVGVLSGLMAFFINLIFDITFCCVTGFSDFGVINISTIIYGSIIPITLSSIAFFYFDKITGGLYLYIICFASITVYLIYYITSPNTYTDLPTPKNFINLSRVVIAILGFFAIVIVPFLAKHKKITDKII